jgi:formate dehydrogenase gamma subunit
MKTEGIDPQTVTPEDHAASKVLRFRTSERLLHWALAVPFLVCLTTALVLVIHYNPDPTRPYRAVFAATHRIAGIAFVLLPILATLISKGDFRTHFYNIRQAWIWTLHDIKWLLLMGLAAVNKKIVLPEQDKFNAAEKLNFMYLMSTYSLYIFSGAFIWLTDAAFVAWIVHCAIAFLAIPLILGHIYMAVINPGSRVGLPGMFTGYVDRHWARHHYTKWYRAHFENEEKVVALATAEQPGRTPHAEGHPPHQAGRAGQEVTRSTGSFFSATEINELLNFLGIKKAS